MSLNTEQFKLMLPIANDSLDQQRHRDKQDVRVHCQGGIRCRWYVPLTLPLPITRDRGSLSPPLLHPPTLTPTDPPLPQPSLSSFS